MPIIRSLHVKNYTVISNTVLTHPKLSLATKGIFCYLLSKPDNWNIHANYLAKQLNTSRYTIAKCIKELEENNFLIKRQLKDHRGRFKDWEYILYETPFETPIEIPIPQPVLLKSNLPKSENRTLINTETTTNTEKAITKIKTKGTDRAVDEFRSPMAVAIAPVCAFSKKILFQQKPYPDDELFKKLWDSYPKEGRKASNKAKAAFLKHKVTEDSIKIILERLEAQKCEKTLCAQKGVFCASWRHITTWLNQRGWEDEVLTKEEIERLGREEAKKRGKIYQCERSRVAPELRGR